MDNLEIIFELVSSKYIQYTDFFQIQILQAIARIISWIVEDLLFSNLQILRLAISALISISPNYAVSRKRERLAPINQFKQMHIPQVLANYLIIVLIRVLCLFEGKTSRFKYRFIFYYNIISIHHIPRRVLHLHLLAYNISIEFD